MSIPLLQTKLYIPRVRPELVSRPRLIEQLNAGLQRKLTLISAPAGFGKTTLLSEWVADCGPRTRVAWVSLGKGDNAPTRFWAYFKVSNFWGSVHTEEILVNEYDPQRAYAMLTQRAKLQKRRVQCYLSITSS